MVSPWDLKYSKMSRSNNQLYFNYSVLTLHLGHFHIKQGSFILLYGYLFVFLQQNSNISLHVN